MQKEEKTRALSKRFAKARKELRMTQSGLATSLGFKQSYISNIEKGISVPTSQIIIDMYRIHRISPRWLLIGKGMMQWEEEIEETKLNLQRREIVRLKELIVTMEQTIKSQAMTIAVQEKMLGK